MITSTVITTWLGTKLAENAFNSQYKKYFDKAENLEKELKKSIEIVPKDFEAEFPEILGNSINYFLIKKRFLIP